MKKWIYLLVFALIVSAFPLSTVAAKEKLTVYTSMKEVLIGKLRDSFVKKNPDVEFDY